MFIDGIKDIGMLDMKTILLIYTWCETGLFFSLAEILIKMAGDPGQFLASWIRKRFHYKQMIVFKYKNSRHIREL